MGTKNENIRFNVYLNDKSAGNTMAGMQKQARILRADIRKLEIGSKEWLAATKKLKRVQKDMQKVNAQMRIQKSLISRLADNFNKYIMLFGAGAAGLTGLIMGFRKLSDVVVEFEKRMTNVYTLLSPEQVKEFGASLDETAIKLIKRGHDIETVTKAMFDSISAGIDPADMEEFGNVAERLAVGGVTELSVATDGLTSVLNAYHLNMSESSNVADAFFSAQKAGKTTVEELAQSIGSIAPIASNLDISYQELLASMSAMTKNGIDTASATTYLKGAMTALIKPTSDATKLFEKEFGHGLGATAVKTQGFNKILSELSQLMEKYPDEMAKAIPNVRGLTAVTALSGEGLEVYSEIFKQVQTDIGETSSLQSAYAMQQETTDMAIRRAKGSLTALTLELRDNLSPVIRGVMGFVSSFSHGFLNMSIWIKENYGLLKKIVIGIIAYTTAVKASIVWDKLKVFWNDKIIASLKNIQKMNRTQIWGLVAAGVAVAITALIEYQNKLKAVNKYTKEFQDQLARSQGALVSEFEALKKTNIGTDERRKAINTINEKYGQYLDNLLTEKSSLAEIEAAQKKANSSLEESIRLRLLKDERSKIYEEKIKAQNNADLKYSNTLIEKGVITKEQIKSMKKVIEANSGAFHTTEQYYKALTKLGIVMDDGSHKRTELTDYFHLLQKSARKAALELNSLNNALDTNPDNKGAGKPSTNDTPDDDEASRKEKERQDERIRRQKEASDKILKDRKDLATKLNSIEEQQYINSLSNNEKEQYALEQKYAKFRKAAHGNAKALAKIDKLYIAEKEALALKQTEEGEKALLDFKKQYKLLSDDELYQLEIDAIQKKYDQGIIKEEEYQAAIASVKKKWQDKADTEQAKLDQAKFEARKLYKMATDGELMAQELAQLQSKYDKQLLTDEEYLAAKDLIHQKYIDKEIADDAAARQKKADNFVASINQQKAVVDAMGNFVNGMMDAELANAGDNEEKKKQIRKKYADTQFAISIAQIVANTALAIMQAFAQLGPVAGGIASLFIAGLGMVQIGNAKKERDKVKAMALGGPVEVISDYDNQVYSAYPATSDGGLVKRPTLFPGGFMAGEKGSEYVIPSWLRNDPQVADFESVIERKRVRGFAEGGDTAVDGETNESMDARIYEVLNTNAQFLSALLQNGVEGVWEWDTFKTGFDHMNEIESK